MLAVVTQLVVIAAPALLMTIMLTSSPRQTLLLRRPAVAGRCRRRPLLAVAAASRRASALQVGGDAALSGQRGAAGGAGSQVFTERAGLLAAGAGGGRGAGRLRGAGLPRVHPLGLPPPGPQVAGDRLHGAVLRPHPRDPAAVDDRLPGGRGDRLPGRAERQHPARHGLPPVHNTLAVAVSAASAENLLDWLTGAVPRLVSSRREDGALLSSGRWSCSAILAAALLLVWFGGSLTLSAEERPEPSQEPLRRREREAQSEAWPSGSVSDRCQPWTRLE